MLDEVRKAVNAMKKLKTSGCDGIEAVLRQNNVFSIFCARSLGWLKFFGSSGFLKRFIIESKCIYIGKFHLNRLG